MNTMRKFAWLIAVVLLLGGAIVWLNSLPNATGLDAEVSRAIPKIEEAVGLPFKSPPVIDSRSRAEVAAFLRETLEDSSTAREVEGQEIVMKLLGMIPDSISLRDVLMGVLEEQIVGYYDPAKTVLYVVDSSPPGMRDVTVTHELIHALQDQYISLDSIQAIRGTDDRQLAAQAVMEGQATLEQIRIMVGEQFGPFVPGGWEALRQTIADEQQKMPRFTAAPYAIQEMLLFPYLSGAEFVNRFRERMPDSLIYNHMPASSEQILHTEAFFGTRDMPMEVQLPAPTSGRALYQNTMGEFGVRLFLYEHLRNAQESFRGAAGWGGDRFLTVQLPSGRGIVWATVWDSAIDAAEFQELLDTAVRRRYGSPSPLRVPAAERVGSISGIEFRTGDKGRRRAGVIAAELDGKPAVIYVDVPEGATLNIVDLRAIRIRS